MPKESIDYSRRTALYRLFDSKGRLLYVGITFNPRNRWPGHSATKSWWPDVARREVEWHESRYAAEQAESAAIVAERPRYNIAGADVPPAPAPPKERRAIAASTDLADRQIAAAAAERERTRLELLGADVELRDLLVRGRAAGLGPSHMAKLTGFTREWVAKVAPAQKTT